MTLNLDPTVVLPLPTSRPTVMSTAYERLRRDILRGVLRPGDRLRLQQLSDSYGCGMGAVREALARLVGDNIVEFEDRRGFSVPLISRKDLLELLDMRMLLEEKALREAIIRGGIDWEVGVTAAFHRLSRTEDRRKTNPGMVNEDWERAHAAFHLALVSAYDFPLFHQFRNAILAHSDRYRHIYLSYASEGRDHLTEHHAIMEAALRRDANTAVALSNKHLQRTVELLLAAGFAEDREKARGRTKKTRVP